MDLDEHPQDLIYGIYTNWDSPMPGRKRIRSSYAAYRKPVKKSSFTV